jgi:Zn-dependent peptidase ImmA (M78 family)
MRNQSKPEKKAARLLQDLKIRDLPVPVDEIATTLGAVITYEPFDGEVSGMLVRDDGGSGPLIGINSKHATTRQRFSMAHEIAHLVMHTGKPMFVDRFVRVNYRNGESDSDEVEANAFAAELLMPRNLVAEAVDRALAKQQWVTPDQLAKQLAKVFHVSPEAMSYRLQNLEVVDPSALAG